MARVRGGNTGYAVALVIFGAGFVITLLVAVILYTKIEAHKSAEQAAKDELAKYVASSETGAAGEYIADGNTAVAGMLAKIQAQQDELAKQQRDIDSLTAETKSMEKLYDDLAEAKKGVDATLAAETEQAKQMLKQRQDQANALMNEKDALVAQISDLRQKVTDSISNADDAARDRIAELTQKIGELEGKGLELENKIAMLTSDLAQAREKLPKLPELNTTFPDGRVTSVFGGGRDLFINLGRNNGLVIGMTFEIFDPMPVIYLNTAGEPRGKATVEVYALDKGIATCRVVRLERGEKIEPGDPIVNIAYDPDMEIKMFAFGDFDIEYDGGGNDIGRINNLITANGAKIPDLKFTDDGIPVLSPDLSYVVLGQEPVLPDKPGADVFDPVIIEAYQKKRAEVEAYFSIVEDAKSMRIPILSQERFLDLVGYYVR